MCVAEWEPLPHEFFAFLCTGANPPCLLKRVQYGICSLMHSLWSQACALRRQSCNASEASFKINRRSLLAKPVQGFYLSEQMGKMQEMATEVLLIKRDDKLSVWVSVDPPLHTWWVICFYFPRDCKEKKNYWMQQLPKILGSKTEVGTLSPSRQEKEKLLAAPVWISALHATSLGRYSISVKTKLRLEFWGWSLLESRTLWDVSLFINLLDNIIPVCSWGNWCFKSVDNKVEGSTWQNKSLLNCC